MRVRNSAVNDTSEDIYSQKNVKIPQRITICIGFEIVRWPHRQLCSRHDFVGCLHTHLSCERVLLEIAVADPLVNISKC